MPTTRLSANRQRVLSVACGVRFQSSTQRVYLWRSAVVMHSGMVQRSSHATAQQQLHSSKAIAEWIGAALLISSSQSMYTHYKGI